jgi:hypothetical protein
MVKHMLMLSRLSDQSYVVYLMYFISLSQHSTRLTQPIHFVYHMGPYFLSVVHVFGRN